MTQVSSRAIGNPYHHRSGESSASTGTSVPAVRPLIGLMLAVAALAFALAVRAPLTLTVLGLIAFGVLHNVLEIRYVAGRFAGLLTERFLLLLLALTSGIAICRVLAQLWPMAARYGEVGSA